MTAPTIMTQSGIDFDLVKPCGYQFDVHDGAAALSRLCRFGGHLSPEFEDSIYSVAQHSCYVHDALVDYAMPRAAFWGLMHDFCEAYYGDTITPLKRLFPELERMEESALSLLRMQWGIPHDPDIEQHVHAMDKAVGCAEAFMLKGREQAQHMYGFERPPFDLHDVDPNFECWSPARARDEFIKRYRAAKARTIEQETPTHAHAR